MSIENQKAAYPVECRGHHVQRFRFNPIATTWTIFRGKVSQVIEQCYHVSLHCLSLSISHSLSIRKKTFTIGSSRIPQAMSLINNPGSKIKVIIKFKEAEGYLSSKAKNLDT